MFRNSPASHRVKVTYIWASVALQPQIGSARRSPDPAPRNRNQLATGNLSIWSLEFATDEGNFERFVLV